MTSFRLPIPSNWQDFESLCHALWKDIWADPNAQKNGRLGQAQSGVDVFGVPHLTGSYAGVQCKDRDGRLGRQVGIAELRQEVLHAMSFTPRISCFSLATTAPRDAEIQEEARAISTSRDAIFAVSVWSWDDIEVEILARPQILQTFYGEIFTGQREAQSQLKIGALTARDQLTAFFSRSCVIQRVSSSLAFAIAQVVQELADNAFKHGSAAAVGVGLDEDGFCYWDDGAAFDPLVSLNEGKVSLERFVGSFMVSKFRGSFSDVVSLRYLREDASPVGRPRNVLRIDLRKEADAYSESPVVDVILDSPPFCGRVSAQRWAETVPISSEVREVVLTVGAIALMSGFFSYLDALLKRLPSGCILKVLLPRDGTSELLGSVVDDPRVVFVSR